MSEFTSLAKSAADNINGEKMENHTSSLKGVTVRELIVLLLNAPMDGIIVVRDKKGEQLHDITLNVREADGLACLFG